MLDQSILHFEKKGINSCQFQKSFTFVPMIMDNISNMRWIILSILILNRC